VLEKDPWPHNQFYRPDGTASRILNINSGGVSTHPPEKVVKDAAATVDEPGKSSSKLKREKKHEQKRRDAASVKTELANKGSKVRKVTGDQRAGTVSEQKSDDEDTPDPQPPNAANTRIFCANFLASLCSIKKPDGSLLTCAPNAGKECKYVHPKDLKAITVPQAKSCATFLKSMADTAAKKQVGTDLLVFIDANSNSFA
jgi:protein-tyrosine-phosphatase